MKLRIKTYLNRLKTDYNSDFAKAGLYFKKNGVDITFDFQMVDVQGYTVQSEIFSAGQRYILEGSYALLPNVTGYDVIMFAFNGAEFIPPAIPTSNCLVINGKPFINLQSHPNDPINLDWTTICHEIMHALTRLAWIAGYSTIRDNMDTYRENINPDSPTGNFAEQWGYLKPFLNMSNYKYFKDSEVVGLQPELVYKLDTARGYANTPFVITSGLRSVAQNSSVGGAKDSTHLMGQAADIACTDQTRWTIIMGAIKAGFNRIEACPTHVHLDIANNMTHPAPWFGVATTD